MGNPKWYCDDCLCPFAFNRYVINAIKDYCKYNEEDSKSIINTLLESYKVWLNDISLYPLDWYISRKELINDVFNHHETNKIKYFSNHPPIITAPKDIVDKIILGELQVLNKRLNDVAWQILYFRNGEPVIKYNINKHKKIHKQLGLDGYFFPFVHKDTGNIRIVDCQSYNWVETELCEMKFYKKTNLGSWSVSFKLGEVIDYC